jgi:multiple sugar transport system substrate-binding protein
MKEKKPTSSGISRRRLLVNGTTFAAAGLAGIGGFPFINRMAVRAQDAPLKFWQFYAPGGQVAPQVEWFEKAVADWNDSHDQKVELEFIPNKEYINGPKLATAFASGEGPDIFIISPGDFLRYYNGGVLQDLTPHMDDAAKADFPESVLATRMVDGKIYGLPMEVEPMAMYYSVKAFEEAGLNENDVPKTWDVTACSSRQRPAIIRTSPGIPSSGRAAVNSRRPTARAHSTRRRLSRH